MARVLCLVLVALGALLAGPGLARDLGAFQTAPHLTVDPIDLPTGTPPPGGVIRAPRLVTLTAADLDPTIKAKLWRFGDALVRSRWFRAFADEYGLGKAGVHKAFDLPATGGQQYVFGPTGATGPGAITGPSGPTIGWISEMLTHVPPEYAPNGHTLYVFYAPENALIVRQGVAQDCTTIDAYHPNAGLSLGDSFAVIPHCPLPIGAALDEADTLTYAASHEVSEALTNTGGGWGRHNDSGKPWDVDPTVEDEGSDFTEVADLCPKTDWRENGFRFTRVFSNFATLAGGDPCVPALSVPYFNVDANPKWTTATAGQTVVIPITGWSTAAVPDWVITLTHGAHVSAGILSGVSLSGRQATIASTPHTVINNGETATVSVTLPSNAASNDWFTLVIDSTHLFPDGSVPPAEDRVHRRLLGIHVP